MRVKEYTGLVKYGGDYYYVSKDAKVVKNVAHRYINRTNGLTLPNGTPIVNGYYDFDADGKMIINN